MLTIIIQVIEVGWEVVKRLNAPKSNDVVKIQGYLRPDLIGFGKYNLN
ncbi:hypothetical protein LGK95_14325 [Clostridium algoriphilum]|nr:hypothetical protein [Clostridium algoriphilum]MCB2294676.1 hypothetical protein [Clostridium algoriphilum]